MASKGVSEDDEQASRYLESGAGVTDKALWLGALGEARLRDQARAALKGLSPEAVQAILDELNNKK